MQRNHFIIILFLLFLLPSPVEARREIVKPPPKKAIEEIENIFELIWRHREPGALEKLEQILKRDPAAANRLEGPVEPNGYMYSLGGCPPIVHAVSSGTPWHAGPTDIRKERYDHLLLLLEYGADVTAQCTGRNHESALHFAAEKGDIAVIYLLTEKGAKLDAKDSLGRTPIFRSVLANPETTNLLLHLGASASIRSENFSFFDNIIYFTKPDILKVLLQHVKNEEKYSADIKKALDEARKRLKRDPGNYDLKECISLLEDPSPHSSPPSAPSFPLLPAKQNSPLISAIIEKDTALVRELLSKKADVRAVSTDGNMPLHIAIQNDSIEIAELLLNSDAPLNISNARGETPLILGRNNPEMLKLLLKDGAEVDRKGIYQQTAFQLAENIEARKLLLSKGANINHRSAYGYNALINAVFGKDKSAVEFLLDNEADVNIKKDDGTTPLHTAVESGETEIVDLLLARGADVSLQNYRGATPYDIAVARNDQEAIKKLSRKGADFGDKERLVREAIYGGKIAFLKTLLDAGVDPNLGYLPTYGSHPLILLAAQSYRPESDDMVSTLIDYGARIDVTDSNRNTLLHLVSDPGLVARLIEKGLSPDSVNDRRESPLHIFAVRGDPEAVGALLKNGAYPNARNKHGLTPLEIALQGPLDHRPADGPAPDFKGESPLYLKTIKLLLDAGANTEGLLEKDFSKAPYYYGGSNDTKNEYKIFLERALSLIRTSDTPVATQKIAVKDVQYAPPREDTILLFRMVSERFINKYDVVRWRTGKNPALICNIDVLKAAKRLFEANRKSADDFGTFLTNLRGFPPPGIEIIDGTRTFPPAEFQGFNLLHVAAYYNDYSLIEEILKAGVDASSIDGAGNTALIYSARGETLSPENRFKVIGLLLSAGIDINQANFSGETALFTQEGMMFSASQPTEHLRLIEFLISKGADTSVVSNEGKTVLDILIKARETAFKRRTKFPDQLDQYTAAILKLLGKSGSEDDVKALREISRIEFGGKRDAKLEAVLTDAIRAGDHKAMQSALEAGAPVDYAHDSAAPLFQAVYRGDIEAIKILVASGANKNIQRNSRSVLHSAILKNNPELVKTLLNLKFEPHSNDLYAFSEQEFLSQQQQELLNRLLKKGLNPNICNSQGESPLYKASARGNVEAVRNLLQAGALIEFCSKDPREVAKQQKHLQIVELLPAEKREGISILPELDKIWNEARECRIHKLRGK